jgi:hypothetical protein
MKILLLMMTMTFSANLYSAEGCKRVGELKKCEIM